MAVSELPDSKGFVGTTWRLRKNGPAFTCICEAETQATAAIKKAEPTPAATESQAKPAPIKAVPVPSPKMDPTSVKMETTPTAALTQIEHKTTVIPAAAKGSPVTEEKQPPVLFNAEPTMASLIKTDVPEKAEVSNADIPKTLSMETKEKEVKMEFSGMELPISEKSEPDIPKVKVDAGIATASLPPVTEATLVSTSPLAAEDALPGVPVTEVKSTPVSAPETIIKEEKPDDEVKQTEPTKSVQQIEVEPDTAQETQLVSEAEPVTEADIKKMADTLAEKIVVTSTPETPVSTKTILIKVSIGHLSKNNY